MDKGKEKSNEAEKRAKRLKHHMRKAEKLPNATIIRLEEDRERVIVTYSMPNTAPMDKETHENLINESRATKAYCMEQATRLAKEKILMMKRANEQTSYEVPQPSEQSSEDITMVHSRPVTQSPEPTLSLEESDQICALDHHPLIQHIVRRSICSDLQRRRSPTALSFTDLRRTADHRLLRDRPTAVCFATHRHTPQPRPPTAVCFVHRDVARPHHDQPPSPPAPLPPPQPPICSYGITKTLERYENCSFNPQENSIERETQNWSHEVIKLKAKYESLQRTQRHLLGEDLGPLSIKVQNLEKQLENALSQTRQKKTQVMMEHMEELRRKVTKHTFPHCT
ncbi:PREDICTED: uncharacterized protein LOC109158403 [Ipomoea nil]|uniref:uncharacterized protein LOC109158403 n=1 Tax=Ipomoea nil TaxID=35883 RepID=UPI0009011316|nr:PREDICTED: uncharacterized protein LOC109158403 [Ipomoea nil]